MARYVEQVNSLPCQQKKVPAGITMQSEYAWLYSVL